MTSKILPCDLSSVSFPSSSSLPEVSDPVTLFNLQEAARHLQNDDLVAFPTETVYGLGGSALASSSAVPKIFKAKGRPSDNPLIVHIASGSQLSSLVDPAYLNELPECYSALMNRFWPGPLTLLFPTIPGKLVSEKVTCGLKTVGIRVPSHPVARALLALSGVPVAAPSANTSGRPSPTTAKHVDTDLLGKEELACILDGGDCTIGLESTVVSALPDGGAVPTDHKETLRVLRLGGVSPEDLQMCLEKAGLTARVTLSIDAHSLSKQTNGDSGKPFIPSTPGMKYKHYSPDAKVILIRSSTSDQAISLQEIVKPYQGKKIGLLHLTSSEIFRHFTQQEDKNPVTVCLGDTEDFETQAQRLFGGLRSLDEQGVDLILVEAVEERGLGRTVMERLRKSAGGTDPIDVKL